MGLIENFLYIITIIIVFASAFSTEVFANVEFGACAPEKNTCKDCYLALKQELLKQDGNIYNLSKAFFPPDTNPPEFVKVTYKFVNGDTINQSQTWFWVEQSSYFLFPPNTFQFLSLFFGKPERYYSQNVSVILNANECLGVDKGHLTLLTQRVRNNHVFCMIYMCVHTFVVTHTVDRV